MSRVCQVTGKRPAVGNNRSQRVEMRHVVVFFQTFTLTVSGLKVKNRFVTLRLTAKGMRIIDKKGIDAVLAEIRARGEKNLRS